MSNVFSQPVLEYLRKAGWHEGRNVPVTAVPSIPLELFEKARVVLGEFGGLDVGECGPGIVRATSNVDFDPASASHLSPKLKLFADSMGVRLYPLGNLTHHHGWLVIDEHGRTYLMYDKLYLIADTFPEAFETLLLGKRKIII